MQDPEKSDLDESLNVTESHDRALREAAAVAREKHVDEGGREPVSLWIFASCSVVFIFAGLALGNIGSFASLFDYDQTVRPGYVRLDLGEEGASGPPPAEALDVFVRRGKKIYGKCTGCHGADGKGGAAYPSLVGSEWALGDTQRFAMIILNGLVGPTSTGKEYGVMQAQRAGMTPEDLAAVMTYVRNSFGNESGDVITPEMAQHAFELADQRADPSAAVDKQELDANYLAPLDGDPIEPTTLIDPVTLEPVEDSAS